MKLSSPLSDRDWSRIWTYDGWVVWVLWASTESTPENLWLNGLSQVSHVKSALKFEINANVHFIHDSAVCRVICESTQINPVDFDLRSVSTSATQSRVRDPNLWNCLTVINRDSGSVQPKRTKIQKYQIPILETESFTLTTWIVENEAQWSCLLAWLV